MNSGVDICTGQAVELSNGNIVFVWQHSQNEYKYRVYDSNGDPVTDPLSVTNGGNLPPGLQLGNISYVYLAANDQGQFLITYSSSIYGKYVGTLYNSDGTRIEINGYHHFDLQPKDMFLYGAVGLDNGKFAILYDTATDEVIIQIMNNEGAVEQTISTERGTIITEDGGYPYFILRGLKSGQFVLAGIYKGNLYIQQYDSNSTEPGEWEYLEFIDTGDLEYTGYIDDTNIVSIITRFVFAGHDPGLFGYYNANQNQLVVYSMGPSTVDAETPKIEKHPEDKTVLVDANESISVSASTDDDGTLSYQWYSNSINSATGGTLISGATM
jgi:hypothetical protein